MFTLTYLRRELRRRAGRTLLTVLGLAVGVGLVAAITSVSAGLDRAQKQVLDPLGSVGTDLLVTRPVEPQQGQQSQAPGGLGGPGAVQLSPGDAEALLSENSSVITDLSKLGNPGDRFVHDFFLPATQLTFPSEQASEVASLDGVAAVGTGLTLVAVHQEGTVPEIVAEFQTGGEEIQVDQEITPPTAEEQAKIEACLAEARRNGAGPEPLRQCLPDRFSRFRGIVRTPQRTIRQVLNPPQTDIESETYTIAGVDLTTPGPALITKDQVTEGGFFSEGGATEAVLAEAYARRKGIAVGGTLDLNGTAYTVVGLAKPPLGGQAADVYLPLGELQRLSEREGRVNVLLVRATGASEVQTLSAGIEQAFPGARVTSAEDVAERVSGSLVDAANLTERLGVVLSAVVLGAAFLTASLLTLSSVSKRVRELGTLKAIGWRKGRVVRQVVAESLAQGALGGLVGVGLGVAAAWAIAAFAPPLEASAAVSGPGAGFFGLGQVSTGATETVSLQAPIEPSTLLLAIGLALVGGLVAGAAGAFRAARLRPAAALRDVG